MTDIQTVGVVGAGTMGNGIAHVFARSGYRVLLCEVERRFLDRGLETIRKNLSRDAEKGKIGVNDVDDALARIEGTLDRTDLAEANLIVEAATEKFEVKKALFEELDKIAQPGVILASNTSSISITRLAAVTGRPER